MAKSSALKSLDHDLKWPWFVLVLLALIALPFVANSFGEAFYIALVTRILIFVVNLIIRGALFFFNRKTESSATCCLLSISL